MHPAVEAAKGELTRSTDRLANALKSTPADKQNWSPTETSRSPVHVVAHAAMSIEGIRGWLDGNPFPFSSMKELDDFSRAQEAGYSSAEEALALLEKQRDAYLAFLDSLSDEQVNSTFKTPMGEFPYAFAITFAADHTRGHAAQIDYIQTIYGDRQSHGM